MPAPNRSLPPIPYEYLAEVPGFIVTSDDIGEGREIDKRFVADASFGLDGENLSPNLRWEGFPSTTKSFAITCFDPDAPTGSGFWHWLVHDIPASVTELATGAASGDMAGLPEGSVPSRNDTGNTFYVGPFPPAGHGTHRYVYAVHALDVETLGLDGSVPAAVVGFNIASHIVGRGVLTATFGIPA